MPQRQLLPCLKIGEPVKCNEVVRAVNSLCEDIISKRDEIYIYLHVKDISLLCDDYFSQ